MDGTPEVAFHRRTGIDCLAEDVQHSSQQLRSDRDLQRMPGVQNPGATRKSSRRVQSDSTDCLIVQLSQDFDDDFLLIAGMQFALNGR